MFNSFFTPAKKIKDSYDSNSSVHVKLHQATIKIHSQNNNTLKRLILNKKQKSPVKLILDSVNLAFTKGERIGIIGHNGSGKSTLLRVIAGIYPLTSGTVSRSGTISVNMERGSGLDGELNLRQNIQLSLATTGRYHLYSQQVVEEVLDYAELSKFSDQPLKLLSSGMLARLSFAISMIGDADILLLDEAFATGDANFIKKSTAVMHERIKSTALLFFVSHQMDSVQATCTRTIILSNGRVIGDGATDDMLREYGKINKSR
ncbi:MAG: ABC transporter ATP-binding protein [Magnetococcales bacterium]|nr:ABC transporter ATP-binding protein [Magnetococcales bacterium]